MQSFLLLFLCAFLRVYTRTDWIKIYITCAGCLMRRRAMMWLWSWPGRWNVNRRKIIKYLWVLVVRCSPKHFKVCFHFLSWIHKWALSLARAVFLLDGDIDYWAAGMRTSPALILLLLQKQLIEEVHKKQQRKRKGGRLNPLEDNYPKGAAKQKCNSRQSWIRANTNWAEIGFSDDCSIKEGR